jgi:cyclopropane-fatty-acyl-phospholipid synthase
VDGAGRDENDWMARFFFTGGITPGDDLLLYFQRGLRVVSHGQVPGWHYTPTRPGCRTWTGTGPSSCRCWPVPTAPPRRAAWVYWRVFFMACAELWGYADAREWLVPHSLFERHSLNGAQKR